ncbi:MAG: hypothetical protein IJ722_00185 [Alloprevotella sp.]|nr:hypothetical protein [Alloprevotella sp.]
MDENMKLNAALPADMRATETGADAAPEREKKYVKPRMQVFPLDCQLLAASGVSGEPVRAGISGYIDMYASSCRSYIPAISCDDFRNTEFIRDKIPMNAGFNNAWCFRETIWYDPFPAYAGVSFSSGVDWDVTDFLANVEFLDPCPGFDVSNPWDNPSPLVLNARYKGHPVIVKLSIGMTSLNDE